MKRMESEFYLDKNLMEIREGDLLKVYHFKSSQKMNYMYHVVVFNPKTNMLECKNYNIDGCVGHYRLKNICSKKTKVHLTAEIVNSKFHIDWYIREQEARKRRKQAKNQTK